ncbi:hypothetical protein [Clostridium estertheticum]|uniref:hypothetical protein n=1 Tax=Clostridium estertheticum TaxID=238834 RepID=UPI001C0CC155|nr:hypothetical protein [Clostridium estertheticum]MBU3173307.1 hypothetical protein [Clostridium estertheticum]
MNTHVKLEKYIMILIFIVVAILAVVFSNTSKNNTNISINKAISDLNGKKIESVIVSKNNLKSLKIVDKEIDGQTLKLTCAIVIEYTEKRAGQINKYLIKNDISHHSEGNIYLNYSKNNNQWQLENINNIEDLKEITNEVPTSIKIIPFDSSDNKLLEDLKSSNLAITILKPSVSITFGKNNVQGYIPIVSKKTFKIVKIDNKNNGIWNQKLVTISIDVDFNVNDLDNMFERNGQYNSKGQFKVLYQLGEDNQNKSIWNLISIVDANEIKTIPKEK